VFSAARPALVRRPDQSPIGSGVSSGIAEHLGVPVVWVRLAFVLSGLVGIGLALYGAAWALMPTLGGGPAPAMRFRARDAIDIAAYAAIAIGLADLVQLAARGIPLWILLPVGALGAGIVVMLIAFRRNSAGALPSTASEIAGALRSRPGTIARTVAGIALALGGATALLAMSGSWIALRQGVLALIVLFAGLAIVFGPWLWRLASDLVAERRARVRNEERADMAAHLHDSVLQTLAMVQRRADDPAEVVRLARRQERELRDWLLAGQPTDTTTHHDTLGAALAALAAELEDLHGVPIELVQVRDCPPTERTATLLQATREAVVNAQRHSGAARVSLYCEVEADAVVMYVRDRGRGFDRNAVDSDRRGIAESIEGRLARHGGTATIRSSPGDGTEVMMRMPLEVSP
jgi:signal transduction histidine kinase